MLTVLRLATWTLVSFLSALCVFAGVTAQSPCTAAQVSVPHTFPASTGCMSAVGQCDTTLTVTIPSNCSQPLSPPYKTVILFAGYQVPSKYYHSLADSLAANGFIVIQYERAENMPSASVESAFWEPLMQWRRAANSSASSTLHGLFGAETAVAGHSMGGALASVAAGLHADDVSTAFLMDPVDWDYASNRVSATYLTRFNKPVAIMSVGVHCKDRAGCFQPTNCSLGISNTASSSGCTPSWWCCDWDHGLTSPSGRITPGARLQPNGAQSFWDNASGQSWQIYVQDSGHMSFLDYDPDIDPDHLLSCPYTAPHTEVQPYVQTLLVTWMRHMLQGSPLGTDWASQGVRGFMMQKATA